VRSTHTRTGTKSCSESRRCESCVAPPRLPEALADSAGRLLGADEYVISADEETSRRRLRLATCAAGRGDAARHVAGREECWVVGIDHRGEGTSVAGFGEQIRQVGVSPGPQAFLEQPGAHDVAQVTDGAVDPALVGEVRGAAGLGEHGGVARGEWRKGCGTKTGTTCC
jgi:hypothetical protein